MLVRVLLATGPPPVKRRLQRAFEQEGAAVTTAHSRRQLWQRLMNDTHDLVVVGGTILPDPPGPLVEAIRKLPERPEIILTRPTEEPAERARLLATGVLAVLWEGLTEAILVDAVRAFLSRRHTDVVARLRADRPDERYSLNDFIFASPAMRQFMTVARRVAPSESTLLIEGETGVGKERLARALHNESPRSQEPFIAINCGAFPEGLLESELFGHDEGAFTGAARARRGYFELAHGGTIFLDEVADMPVHLQVKLLRMLEERTLRRLGGEREIKVNVRVMAATNRNLKVETEAKRFRLDLYYRLAVVTIGIPPLRDRRDDIPVLAQSYVDHFRVALRQPTTGLTPAAIDALCRYPWPGNVRELINVIERSMLLSGAERLDVGDLHLPTPDGGAPSAAPGAPPRTGLADRPLAEARETLVRDFERAYLADLLGRAGGRVGEAARRAGVNVRSLHAMMKRHDLRKESFKR